jgi:hypothetical protein
MSEEWIALEAETVKIEKQDKEYVVEFRLPGLADTTVIAVQEADFRQDNGIVSVRHGAEVRTIKDAADAPSVAWMPPAWEPGWSPALERSIRDLGDYVERQMKDLLNPAASVTGTSLRVAFRGVVQGMPLMDEACTEAGIRFAGWMGSLKALSDMAEENGSDAAAKIRKALPVAEQLTAAFTTENARGIRGKVKLAKSKGIEY